MKLKYFTFLLITMLGVSTSAYAQTLVIFKNARSIEVDSVRWEHNECIYTKNGLERRVSLGLIEEIYVLNQGTIYPPQYRDPKHPEPTEIQDSEISSDTRETHKRNKRKKKSKDIAASKDTLKPAEQTYLYRPPQGYFQCEIPKSWNHIEMFGVHTFSPYSLDGEAYDKFAVSIIRTMEKAGITTLSKEHRAKMLEALERIGEKLLSERERGIDGIETWEKFVETTRYESKMMHEIMLVHNGYIVSVSLQASPELFQAADREFEKILASLKFL
jgi:hypothetical protein